MKAFLKLMALAVLLAVAAVPAVAQQDSFSNWPAGRSPQEIGKAVAEHFAASPHQHMPGTIHYSEVGTWYGALTFANLTHDTDLRDKLIQRFVPLMPGGAEESLIPRRDHVDDAIFGIVPLEIAIETGDKKYLDYGLSFADKQWADPLPDGLSHQTRYWIDDMYMLTILELQAYRATGDKKYLDRAANEMVAYLDKLQQPNGLFYHAPDAPFFWGRGNGWVAAGMTEMLRSLPADHPQRARILSAYKLMMAALLKYQDSDGMWRQLIDRDEAWEESSGSGMFSFALITGVKSGWLDAATYGPAARKGWIAVTGFIDQNSDVTGVCEGTGKNNSRDYYLARKRRTGDFHGQEPILWAASALLAANIPPGEPSTIRKAIDQVRSMPPSFAREDAARKLCDLTQRKRDAQHVSKDDIKALISLLDDPDMSVQYWSAAALGYIGPRAQAAIPKLTTLFLKTDCLYLDKSPADAALFALKRMKAEIPQQACPSN